MANDGCMVRPQVIPGILCTLLLGFIATVLFSPQIGPRFKDASTIHFDPHPYMSSWEENLLANESHKSEEKGPTIFIITPTYPRSSQQPDLIRVSQSLMLSTTLIHWVIVEHKNRTTDWVEQLLLRTGLPFNHSYISPSTKTDCRGLEQRNLGLDFVEKQARDSDIIYFADDDNTYDYRLFDEMAKVKKIGMAPTAGFPSSGLSTPVVRNGTIIALHDFWIGGRRFPFDMACLSLNVGWWKKRGAKRFKCAVNEMESKFLESLKANLSDMMPLSNNATEIMVWHTKTEKVGCDHKELLGAVKQYPNTNLDALYADLICGRFL